MSRRRRIAAIVGSVVIATGFVGVAAPTTMASVVAGGNTEEPNPPGHDDDGAPHRDDGPKCDSNGYDHDHDNECNATPPPPPPPAPAPEPAPASNRVPDPPYVPGYLLPLVVAPVQAASIYTGSIDCGDTANEPSTIESAGVRVNRLSDAYGECAPADYVINSTEDSVTFLKNGSPYAQFVMTVTWRNELEPPQVSTTFADFELVEGGYELAMPQCPAALYKNGKLVGLPSLADMSPATLAGYGITDMDGMPGTKTTADNGLTQFACVGARGNKFVDGGDPHYELSQEMYILGDIYIRH